MEKDLIKQLQDPTIIKVLKSALGLDTTNNNEENENKDQQEIKDTNNNELNPLGTSKEEETGEGDIEPKEGDVKPKEITPEITPETTPEIIPDNIPDPSIEVETPVAPTLIDNTPMLTDIQKSIKGIDIDKLMTLLNVIKQKLEDGFSELFVGVPTRLDSPTVNEDATPENKIS